MCYEAILDLTTCLQRMVSPITNLPICPSKITESGIAVDREGEKYKERPKCGPGADRCRAGFDRNDGLAGLSFRGIEKVISGKLESAK
jgi:hypothetical protein